MGQPEHRWVRGLAMGGLGSGLNAADKCLEALSVYEAELAMKRHLGQPEGAMLPKGSGTHCGGAGASRMGSGGEVPSRQPAWQWRSVAERAVCAWMEERMERNDSITGRGVDTSSSATWQR